MRKCFVVVASLCSVAVSWANAAQAQNVDGRFQLGLGTPIVSYSAVTTEIGDNPSVEVDVDTTSWGIRNIAMLELGYGLSNALVLGGVLRFGGTSTTSEADLPNSEEETNSSFDVVVGPKIDYMFSEGSRVRPFVSAVVGLLHSSSTAEDDAETSLTGVMLQGGAGLRWFAAPGFSLDPSLRFDWSTMSGETDLGPASIDVSASGFSVSLGLAVSGWI
jgi:hypothetical protein